MAVFVVYSSSIHFFFLSVFGFFSDKYLFEGIEGSSLKFLDLDFHSMMTSGSKSILLNFITTMICQNSFLSSPKLNSFRS